MSSADKITRCFVVLSSLMEVQQTTVVKCGMKNANLHVFQQQQQLVKVTGCPSCHNFPLPRFNFCPGVVITAHSIRSLFEADFNLHRLPLSQIRLVISLILPHYNVAC